MSEVIITAQPDGTFTDSTGKKFLPEEKVNTVVQDRLARDREARKDENAEKAQQAEQKLAEAKAEHEAALAKIKALEGTSATAEEVTNKVKASWDKIQALIPQDKLKLVPAKYSEAEKIEYIAENKELFFPTATTPPPSTPPVVNPQGAGSGDPKFGGYSSLVEWAQRDPHGYQKSRAKG